MSAEPCIFEVHDDLDISHKCIDESEKYFALVVGCIEEIILHEKFAILHRKFMEDNWQQFEESEENKLIYTEIFHDYINKIEKYIQTELVKRIPDFNMTRFENELKKRSSDLEGEIFEILETFSDFVSFKEKFIDYKKMKEGTINDFSTVISVTKCGLEDS